MTATYGTSMSVSLLPEGEGGPQGRMRELGVTKVPASRVPSPGIVFTIPTSPLGRGDIADMEAC